MFRFFFHSVIVLLGLPKILVIAISWCDTKRSGLSFHIIVHLYENQGLKRKKQECVHVYVTCTQPSPALKDRKERVRGKNMCKALKSDPNL